jgi:hypothetical protein
MAHFSALFVPLFTLFFLCVGSAPATNAGGGLGGLSIGDIINALQIGLVSKINAIITVSQPCCFNAALVTPLAAGIIDHQHNLVRGSDFRFFKACY